MWSIRSTDTRRVIDRVKTLIMHDVVFLVSEAGRERVLRERVKNVHAGIEGTVHQTKPFDEIPFHATQVRYNPYLFDYFFDTDGNPVYDADRVYLDESGKAYILE